MLQSLSSRIRSNIRHCAPPAWQVFRFYDTLTHRISAEELDENATFNKILIANRGEIACRIIKTCKSMGIKTVAVFSEKDAQELHVRMADESLCIGPAEATKSYLNIESILKAAEATHSEAVHPGYGFLSENPIFAYRLSSQQISFIGPNAAAISAMGDKIQSKKIAAKAKVSMIPGFEGEVKDISECLKVAREIGYPLMIKASAGGGGKGLRVVWNEAQLGDSFKLAKQEAQNSFGDDRLLVEKFISGAKHIEMQILCDKYGNAVWLNERECSIQRRNQKIIEEAPSPFIDPETRQKMGQQACALAQAVGYDSAGTVEFLVDSFKNFYFLEMNTRLQVEHPITEAITGLDLVGEMIKIAYGHKLNLEQTQVKLNGHSLECRIYAEDPYKNFGTPSVGRLFKYAEPGPISGVRCDSGVVEGSQIGVHYDPLMCKLIVHAQSRQEVLKRTKEALDRFVIRGVRNNLPLLRDIVEEKNFINGCFTTNYLSDTYPDGFQGPKLSQQEFRHLAIVASCINAYYEWKARTSIKNNRLHSEKLTSSFMVDIPNDAQEGDTFSYHTQVEYDDNGKVTVTLDGLQVELKGQISFADTVFELIIDGSPFLGQFVERYASGKVALQYRGAMIEIRVLSVLAKALYRHMLPKTTTVQNNAITAPMPGLTKSVSVKVGQSVSCGEEVCVLEAMKMLNSLLAPRDGIVQKVNCQPGETVDAGAVLIELA